MLNNLRDFAEAYIAWQENGGHAEAVVLTQIATTLITSDNSVELRSFRNAENMLASKDLLADEDRPLVERLRVQAALRFARRLALLPPTEKT
jgi:hypothetical protein